ncbi:MAG: hypothetical protein ABI382_09295, partial [Nakamurella sp.]
CLGARVGEVAGLTLDDIDWRAPTLRLVGKGGSVLVLPMPVDVGEVLVDYLRVRRAEPDQRGAFIRSMPQAAGTGGSAGGDAAIGGAVDQFGQSITTPSDATTGVTQVADLDGNGATGASTARAFTTNDGAVGQIAAALTSVNPAWPVQTDIRSFDGTTLPTAREWSTIPRRRPELCTQSGN